MHDQYGKNISKNLMVSESAGFSLDDVRNEEKEIQGLLEAENPGRKDPVPQWYGSLAGREWLPSLTLIYVLARGSLRKVDPGDDISLASRLLDRLAGALFPGDGGRDAMRKRAFIRMAVFYMAQFFALDVSARGLPGNSHAFSGGGIRPTDQRAVHHHYASIEDFFRLIPMAASCRILNPARSFVKEQAGDGCLVLPTGSTELMEEIEALFIDLSGYWDDTEYVPASHVLARAFESHAPRTGPWALLPRPSGGTSAGRNPAQSLLTDASLLAGAFGLGVFPDDGSRKPCGAFGCPEILTALYLMSMRPYADAWERETFPDRAPSAGNSMRTAETMRSMCVNERRKYEKISILSGEDWTLDNLLAGTEWKWDGTGYEMAAASERPSA